MQIPQQLLKSLQGIEGFEKNAFEKIHVSGEPVTSVRINLFKKSQIPNLKSQIPWSEYGYYLESRPSFTFDPLFHAGCYYVQEASSMFLEQALKQTVDLSRPVKVLDLCAAPGGKSTHIASLISKESLLVSNEVIRSRVNILKDNIIKWGVGNVAVTNNDPKDFAELEDYFDIMVIDAPCSGSGLFRRDPMAIDEWSEANVQLCSQRQQRILADAWQALKKNGILVYATCSYSKEEDEDILDWISDRFAAEPIRLQVKEEWGIVESISEKENFGYRFWPQLVKGEGFFLGVFRKKEGDENGSFKAKMKKEKISIAEKSIFAQWMNTDDADLIKNEQTVYAWPPSLTDDFNILLNKLRLIYSGTIIGELMRNKLVPSHAFAMSANFRPNVESIELEKEQAIQYLQRKNLSLNFSEKGWKLVSYEGHTLGWVNVLDNRVNNYYPKELRILKDSLV